MTTATLALTPPQSFVPPGNRTARLAHLDPRPLWREPAPVASAWRSPTFYVACAIVAPIALVIAPVRALVRLI